MRWRLASARISPCCATTSAFISEKVREPYTNDTLVGDLEGVLKGLKLSPPYSFVTVAAAVTHVLGFMQRHPEQVRSFVFGNPAPGVDPARANALIERGVAAEKSGIRGVLGITLDKSYAPRPRRPRHLRELQGALLANDPVNFSLAHRCLAQTNLISLLPHIKVPTMVVAGKHDTVRPHAGTEELAKKIPRARAFELMEAGHFLPTTGPKTLLKLLKDFLSK